MLIFVILSPWIVQCFIETSKSDSKFLLNINEYISLGDYELKNQHENKTLEPHSYVFCWNIFLNEYFQIIWHDWWEVFPPQGWWDDGDQLYSRVMSATRFLQSSSFPCVSVAAAWLIMMSSPPSSPPAVSGETSQDKRGNGGHKIVEQQDVTTLVS